MSCDLLVLVPEPLTATNVKYSNAEVLSSIALFDPGVIAGAGYSQDAQVILNNGIYSSTGDANKTWPGSGVGGTYFVHDPLGREYYIRKEWTALITFVLHEECIDGVFDVTERNYHVWKSLSASNINNPLPAVGVSDANWEYIGVGGSIADTKTDMAAAFYIGESVWSVEQQKGFTAIIDIAAASGQNLPIVTDEGLTAVTSLWTKIGVINPLKVFEPSHTQRTTRNLNLYFELLLDRRFKELSLWGLTGDNVHIIIEDSSDTEVYNVVHSLDKPVYDYEEWFFDPVEKEDHIIIRDLPWDIESILKIEITGTGECGVGGIYPASAKTLGGMTYTPSIKIIDSTEEVPTIYDSGQNDVSFGKITQQVKYTTVVNPESMDLTIDNLTSAKLASKESGLPLLFIGTDKYKSFQMLGRMQTATVQLNSSTNTSVIVDIIGVI